MDFNKNVVNPNYKYKCVDSALSSGNLLNLEAYTHIKGFNEELFIDWVDMDYCFRLRLENFYIIELGDCVLTHQLGETVEIKLLGKHICFVTNHPATRCYYQTRNALLLSKYYFLKWPSKSFLFVKSVFAMIFKIALFENSKKAKLCKIAKGFSDAIKGICGAEKF